MRTPIFLIIATLLSLCTACGLNTEKTDYVQKKGMVWNTLYSITFSGPEELGDSIEAVMRDVELSLSVFESKSLVSKVNADSVTVIDNHFRNVYETSRLVNTRSHGMFDPTLAPLITAWGFGKGHKATSDTLRLDSLMRMVGIERTYLVGDTLYKDDRRIAFNFSAIAKGYGVDEVGRMLERNGVKDYLVEIGGEVVSAGVSPRGGDWRVGIDRPSDNRDDGPQAIVAFSGMGMATSGDYRNFHEDASGRYGHTISPITGRPARTDVLSATVMAPTCMEADAMATAAMAMGSKEAVSMIASLKLPALLVLADHSVWISPAMRSMLVK